ncbi:MAG: ORF6N domain-containing protein [Thermoleophilia bacterium]
MQIRSQRVMLDFALAELYQVETRVLMQAVRRNIERFPEDFMFQLTKEEAEASRSQFVTLKRGLNIKYLPHAFTEQGVAMLSSVLRSQRAIQVNIEIMRAFVQMKQMLASYEDLARKVDALEKKYDVQFSAVFDAIRQLMTPPDPKKKQIGFHWDEQPAKKRKKSSAKKLTAPKKKR